MYINRVAVKGLNIRNLLISLGLLAVWLILRESVGFWVIVQGIVISVGCTFFFNKFLPLPKADDVDFAKLIFFPFQVIGQIFKCAVYVIEVVFKGARVNIVEVETTLESETLIALLGDILTLTPGSVMLDARGKTLTVLCLLKQGVPDEVQSAYDNVADLDWLEARLKKAQK